MTRSNSEDKLATESKRRRTRKLLASSLAGLLGPSLLLANEVGATVFDEVDAPGGEYGNSFLDATVLPVGTSEVLGTDSGSSADDDFVRLEGLVPGESFGIEFETTGPSHFDAFLARLFRSDGSAIGGSTFFAPGEPGSTSGTIPADGVIVANIDYQFEGGPQIDSYKLTIDAAVVPEPSSTGLLAGAALLGANSSRRKRRSDSDKNA